MSRTRIRSASPGTAYYSRSYSKGSGQTSGGPYVVELDEETMTDVVTENFRSRIANGDIIVNPLSYSRSTRSTSGSGSQSAYNTGQTIIWSATGPVTQNAASWYLPSPPIWAYSDKVNTAIQQAKLNAIANIDRSAIETGEDLLELRQTLSLLRNPIAGILNNLKKVRRRERGSIYEALESNWLQYRFAFSPLVRSIHNILSEVVEPSTVESKLRFVAHGRSRADHSVSAQSTRTNGGTAVFAYSRKFKGDYHATVVYEKLNPVADFRWRYGLRNKDFPKTFWNVLPLSFMIDRVFDVSSAITAAVNLSDPSLKIQAGSITSRQSDLLTTQLISETQSGWTFSVSGDIVSDTIFTMNRSSWKPSFSDVRPAFTPKNLIKDLTNAADLVTLVTSMLRRR